MKRLLVYIFIPVLAILLMSHNTYAADLNVPVRLQDTANYLRGSYMSYGTTTTNVNGLFSDEIISNQIRLYYTPISVYDGLYIDLSFHLFNYTENNSVDGYMNVRSVSCNNGGIPCQIAGVRYSGSGTGSIYHVILYVSGNGSLSDVQLYSTQNLETTLRLFNGERMQPLPLIAYKLLEPSSGGGSPDLSTVNTYIQYISAQLETIYNQLGVMNGNIPSADEIADAINAPDEQASNDIQNQSPSDISNSTNAETQSLLDAFGSFVSAIASISPSNCNVDFDLGHIDFGEQNLCSVSVPTVFTTITSILVIMFTIPFVYHLVNRILGLIREMQT